MSSYRDFLYKSREDKPIPLCFMTLCGHLRFTEEGVILISELVEDCDIPYKLPPGMPIAVTLDKIPYAGHLDCKYFSEGQLGWTIVGTNLWGKEMDGLDVRIPFYVKIERDDGAVFNLENPDSHCDEQLNRGCHFYRYSDMSIKEAVSMHIDGILSQMEGESTWILKAYTESLLSNAPRIDIDTLDFVRRSCANSKYNLPFYSPEHREEIIKYWIEHELKPLLGYPSGQATISHELEQEIYRNINRAIGIPDVPIVKDETPVTTIRTSKGTRYINDAQVLCKEEG